LALKSNWVDYVNLVLTYIKIRQKLRQISIRDANELIFGGIIIIIIIIIIMFLRV